MLDPAVRVVVEIVYVDISIFYSCVLKSMLANMQQFACSDESSKTRFYQGEIDRE